MTPQSTLTVVAPIREGHNQTLRTLFESMNLRPGVVNPANAVVPFAAFEGLHFARFVILDDPTLGDVAAYDMEPRRYRPALAFMADFDGSNDAFLADLVLRAGDGLRQIFENCEGYAPGENLARWMAVRDQRPAASYVNWRGRTVRQVREEAALRDALASYVEKHAAALTRMDPVRARAVLVDFVKREQQTGRLTLTPEAPTPLGWKVRNLAHLIAGFVVVLAPVTLLILAPAFAVSLLIIAGLLFAWQLRRRECSDPEIVPRPDAQHVRTLAALEDHDVTNQFSALGTAKPGYFRRTLLIGLLWALDYAARHVYHRGHLARVTTIHFARWVFLDGRRRLLFASNYDGSLESYMDDFINKVAWGLNLVFSNGVGYPHTDWLVSGGAKDEQKFKRFIRRHELPTEVWYNAHPGLTAVDLARNARIREGLEQPPRTSTETLAWLQLL